MPQKLFILSFLFVGLGGSLSLAQAADDHPADPLEAAILLEEFKQSTFLHNILCRNVIAYKRREVNEDYFHSLIFSEGGSYSKAAKAVEKAKQNYIAPLFRIDTSQGIIRETSHPLHLAISGKGFFRILKPTGVFIYTRVGSFHRGKDGNVVLKIDKEVFPLDPPITIPEEAVAIEVSEEGKVIVRMADQPELDEVGQIQLAYFINTDGLRSLENNLFEETEESGPEQQGDPGDLALGLGSVLSGYLESSNINIKDELRKHDASVEVLQQLKDRAKKRGMNTLRQ